MCITEFDSGECVASMSGHSGEFIATTSASYTYCESVTCNTDEPNFSQVCSSSPDW